LTTSFFYVFSVSAAQLILAESGTTVAIAKKVGRWEACSFPIVCSHRPNLGSEADGLLSASEISCKEAVTNFI
jgi:hypothetical protein